MLPAFPKFKKIELANLIDIQKHVEKYPPYSDFDIVSLWTYNNGNKNSVSILNNNLIIKIQDYITGKYFYSFIGHNNSLKTINNLLIKSSEEKLETKLRLIPEYNLLNQESLKKHFSIVEDPDNHDYILSTNELAELKGGKYYDKRNLVNRFKKLYPQHKVKTFDLTTKKVKQDISKLFSLWKQQKGKSDKETNTEKEAIKKIYDLNNTIEILCTGIYINKVLIGFSTHHKVNENYAAISFQKGDVFYKGIYACILHETAKVLVKQNIKYINYEQDLGIPNLKKAKKLWRPEFFLKKYDISLKSKRQTTK